ncbi:Histone-like transcription factor and archaeal histone protein [Ceratobasidium theobromae]|uniref:Histone-like transcription factor and archaeal histone protein n=1 Tax=Ceratobasidium theobromae TaxID=1582974 RepID=A0A5N5QP23_9AGAM|nr:Histone-like transcription factor and archaeal histone protein [Ceratobasidium theobromae]
MSDHEGPSGAGDDELSLPKATVQKLIAGEPSVSTAPDILSSKESRDLIIECCVEFIHMISTEANEICEKEAKKTISPEHIVGALKTLGFESYVEEVEGVLKDHKQAQKDREKKTSKFEASGKSEEELLHEQQRLFEASRARFQATQ